MAKRPRPKSFLKMTPAQRDKDVAKYDAGAAFEDSEPLTAAEQARWDRARSAHEKAPIDADVPVVIRIDPRLLAKAHAAARRDGKSLSTLISELLSASQRRSA